MFQKRVEARCHKKDRYGREVCAVFVGLRDVGLEQIRGGMAWHYKAYQHEQPTQERLVYAQEEENARASGIGLWKDAKPVPPWEWRKRAFANDAQRSVGVKIPLHATRGFLNEHRSPIPIYPDHH